MATLYVDVSSGNDSAVGSSAAPVKTLPRAVRAAAANDVIVVQNTSLSSPSRGMVIPAVNMTIKAPDTEYAYLTAAQDISHGAVLEDFVYEGLFNSATIPTSWQQANAANNNTDNLYGTYCWRIDSSAGIGYLRRTHAYYGRKFRIRLIYKTSAGAAPYFRFDGTTRYYNLTTGAWQASVPTTDNAIPASTDWTEIVTDWITDAGATESGNCYVYVPNASGTVDVQEWHMEVMTEWVDNEDGNWYAPYNGPVGTYAIAGSISGRSPNTAVAGLFKGDLTDYTNLRIVETDGAIPGSGDEGMCRYDSTSHRYYYRPLTGEDVTELHFEQLFGKAAIAPTAANVTGQNLIFTCNEHAVKSETSGSSVFWNCIEQVSNVGGVQCTGTSSIRWVGGKSRQPIKSISAKQYGGGFVAGSGNGTDSGTMRVEGTEIIYSGDDALQVIDAATMYIHGVTSWYAQSNDIEVSSATSAGALYVHGFSGYGASQNSFRDQNTVSVGNHTIELIDAAFYSDGTNDMEWTTATAATLTVENLFYGVAGANGDGSVPSAVTNNGTVLASPPYTDIENGDFTPTSGSALQGAGKRSTTFRVSATGEPYPDFDIDAGGVQSTHGPFHPVNL